MAFNKARALQEAEQSVAQGKLAQAIRQYLAIIENDPGDLPLLNTAGDLCVRDRNIPEALRLFRRLADAYAREGFTLKAIAIYRKITKLDPNSIEPLLKLAELYAAQGLGRETLRLYAEALQSAERANQTGEALDIMRRIVAADPENEAHRLRLAECCEAAGRHAEAARVYVEAAEAAGRRNDRDAASGLLAKAQELDRSVAGLPGTEALPAAAADRVPDSPPETLPAAPVLELPPEPVARVETLITELEAAPVPELVEAGESEPSSIASPDFPSRTLAAPDSVAGKTGEFLSEAPSMAPVPPLASAPEFDLSGEWEALAAGPTATADLPLFSEEESRAEVEFYLSAGLAEEARRAIQALEEKFPGHPQVAELRRQVEEQAPIEPGQAHAPPTGLVAAPRSPIPAGNDLLQSLAADFESRWTGLDQPVPPSPRAAAKPRTANAAKDFGAALSALLDDLNEEAKQEAPEDPETHYGLGIAFREMGLVEEAIGEFQKVVKLAPAGAAGSQFLPACTLLGVCFMDRQLPALAAKWYRRALESPGVGEDTRVALEYDLGMAYEQAGDSRAALDRFLEVYSQNIDYRDVAEKIRLLQQRPS
ncbi:MAG TPA: tetratricopeptide repeat protein [Terriglobia bacterium]|nr:tetratricopeptide repeat protein [Terriglobia bacterium]